MPPLEKIGALEPQQEALRLQLAPAAAYAPTTARYPASRGAEQAPPAGASGTLVETPTVPTGTARREYESYENIESQRTILAATTAFADVATFAGAPDVIHVFTIGGPVDVRIRYRGRAPSSFVQIPSNGQLELKTAGEVVEARDPGGGGGQAVISTGRYASRSIAVRTLGVTPRFPTLAEAPPS